MEIVIVQNRGQNFWLIPPSPHGKGILLRIMTHLGVALNFHRFRLKNLDLLAAQASLRQLNPGLEARNGPPRLFLQYRLLAKSSTLLWRKILDVIKSVPFPKFLLAYPFWSSGSLRCSILLQHC